MQALVSLALHELLAHVIVAVSHGGVRYQKLGAGGDLLSKLDCVLRLFFVWLEDLFLDLRVPLVLFFLLQGRLVTSEVPLSRRLEQPLVGAEVVLAPAEPDPDLDTRHAVQAEEQILRFKRRRRRGLNPDQLVAPVGVLVVDWGREGDELRHEQLAVFVWAQRQVPLVVHVLDQPHVDRPQLAPHRDVEVASRALVELHLHNLLRLEDHVGLRLGRRGAQARLNLVDVALHVLDVRHG